jgi:protein-L-isoaspartate(D-aspartate) O-methyltransferase
MDRLDALRSHFSRMIAANAHIPEGRVSAAFSAIPRERFVATGPWNVLSQTGYTQSPSSDAAFLYQDVVVAIAEDRQINNGQPSLHAICLYNLDPQPGETAVHIGTGTGYYTAILAHLIGPTGTVDAYEIERDLATRAASNLANMHWVTVHSRSGTIPPLPACDLIYVNAGATRPLDIWLDALRPGGRLLFPLTGADAGRKAGPGGMLLITRNRIDERANAAGETEPENHYGARFVSTAAFINCIGARDETSARQLSAAFRKQNWTRVQSLHRDNRPDDSCWFAGPGWWLSTRA